jgi:methylamine dehydrogenase accessory protein MauD
VVLASDGDRPKQEAFIRQQGLEVFPYVLSTDLGLGYRVNRLPLAVLIDGEGIVRAKGLVNNREQLESLFNAKELGVESIQRYLDVAPAGQA